MEISVNRFGIAPDSLQEAGFAFARAIEAAAREKEPVTLTLETGEYHFYRENAILRKYFISNTTSETEAPDKMKHIGLLFENVSDITLDGGDSLLVFHGKFTQIVFDHARNITVRNLRTDFIRPTMSEMTLTEKTAEYARFLVNEDCPFEIREGTVVWVGPEFEYVSGPTQIYSRCLDRTWRCPELKYAGASAEGRALQLAGVDVFDAEIGDVFQIRDGIRDEVGMFAVHSENIILEDVTAYYMHGLGFVGQFTENIALTRFFSLPNREKGRTNSCFADSVHISGCKGLVTIRDCLFDGLHDDALNVHGTYLAVTGILGEKQARVRYMQSQTYGFEGFFPGDEVEFVNEKTLITFGSAVVAAAEMESEREMILTFDRALPQGLAPGNVLENVSWQPEVVFAGNTVRCDPTRGVLLTSRRKALIENNHFFRTGMSGIELSSDARFWFESGHVSDLIVRGNRFEECGAPVIYIDPNCEGDDPRAWVHQNIRIEENEFILKGMPFLDARSVDGLAMRGNRVTGGEPVMRLRHCRNVETD